MPTSDEDLQARREEVEDLRAQVAQAEADRIAAESSVSNDLVMADLDAEAARLQAQLAQAKAVAKDTDQAVGLPLQAAQDAMDAAVRQQEAAEQAAAAADEPQPDVEPDVTAQPYDALNDPSRTPNDSDATPSSDEPATDTTDEVPAQAAAPDAESVPAPAGDGTDAQNGS